MKGRVVLVTGGANGLGRELVRRLHALGAVLIVWDIDSVALYDLGMTAAHSHASVVTPTKSGRVTLTFVSGR